MYDGRIYDPARLPKVEVELFSLTYQPFVESKYRLILLICGWKFFIYIKGRKQSFIFNIEKLFPCLFRFQLIHSGQKSRDNLNNLCNTISGNQFSTVSKDVYNIAVTFSKHEMENYRELRKI